MAYNGSGVFNRLYRWANDAAANIKISSSRMDAEMDGMAIGLSTALTRDGQSTPTANLPMGGFKHTGAGAPVASTDYATKGYADTMLPLAGGTMSGAIAMGTNKITGLGTPTLGTDAVTKDYIDNSITAGKLILTGNPASGAQLVLSNISSASYVGRAFSVAVFNGGNDAYNGGCMFVNGRNGGTVPIGTSGVVFCSNSVNWAAVVANYPNQVVVGRELAGNTLTIFNNTAVDVAVYVYLL